MALSQIVPLGAEMRLLSCPACHAADGLTLFVGADYPIQRCGVCGLLFLNPQPTDEALWRTRLDKPTASSRQPARALFDRIVEYGGPGAGALLNVGRDPDTLPLEAAANGYSVRHVTGPECDTWDDTELLSASFDICICIDAVEHARDPVEFLAHLHRALKPGGVLVLITAVADSRPGWFRRNRRVTKPPQLHYFSRSAILNVLARTGFRGVEASDNGRAITVICRADPARARPMLSVIVPAYNEGATIRGTLDRLIAKQVAGIDKEIIVVEGNSTDGTREAVLEYRGRPGIQVVLTDRPRGKGHAVRQGLERAEGDFVLIQDADDEYDIDDYDALLEPLRLYQQALVLGSRHKGHWRMRNFGGQASLTAFMNVGHILLTELFNALYGQRLSDPWTMYKVFRRDCLYHAHLECNRFDFDIELVAKLVRRGFTPLEIPVSYRSRSFAQGKKIRVLRDPWSWIWACLKYRFAALDERRSTTRGSTS